MFAPLKSLALTVDTLIQFSKFAGMHMFVCLRTLAVCSHAHTHIHIYFTTVLIILRLVYCGIKYAPSLRKIWKFF